MSDKYSYLLAEILKRNTQLHGNAIKEMGQKVVWPVDAIKVINTEIRGGPFKSDTKLKAISGHVWGWLRGQDLTTRHIYALLLQWGLYLTEKDMLYTYTEQYADLLDELRYTIETGAEGEVQDILPEEILEEWKFVQENYYSLLHNLCSKLIGV